MLIVFVGESGSGKSVSQKYLHEKYGYTPVVGYTTRPKREGETNEYIFADESDYHFHKKYFPILCETEYGGYHYWKLQSEITGNRQSIVVDTNGLKALRETDIPLFVIHIKASKGKRFDNLYCNTNATVDECDARLNRDPEIEFIPHCTVINGNCDMDTLYKRLDKVIQGYVL